MSVFKLATGRTMTQYVNDIRDVALLDSHPRSEVKRIHNNKTYRSTELLGQIRNIPCYYPC